VCVNLSFVHNHTQRLENYSLFSACARLCTLARSPAGGLTWTPFPLGVSYGACHAWRATETPRPTHLSLSK
jgi:hypothetical protein